MDTKQILELDTKIKEVAKDAPVTMRAAIFAGFFITTQAEMLGLHPLDPLVLKYNEDVQCLFGQLCKDVGERRRAGSEPDDGAPYAEHPVFGGKKS